METIFFFGSESKFGFLSNFFPVNIKFEGNNFYTSEQLFMYFKAVYFGDITIAKKILSEPNPKKSKQLGRKVKPFDPVEWDKVRDSYMKKAVMEKFSQNGKLKELLLATKDSELVEASPYDRVWGIGYGVNSREISDKSLWGSNRLGKILVEVREELKSR